MQAFAIVPYTFPMVAKAKQFSSWTFSIIPDKIATVPISQHSPNQHSRLFPRLSYIRDNIPVCTRELVLVVLQDNKV